MNAMNNSKDVILCLTCTALKTRDPLDNEPVVTFADGDGAIDHLAEHPDHIMLLGFNLWKAG